MARRHPGGIVLDAQLMIGTATGIGEYLRGLVPALTNTGCQVTPLQLPWLDPWRFDRRVLWDQLFLPYLARNAALLHCCAGTMPLVSHVPIVVTIHDVAWLRVQHHTRAYARGYFGPLMLNRYRHAQRIIVVSEFSRRELLEVASLDPEHIHVVYPGVDPEFANVARCVQRDAPIILAVGTVERRKNITVVIEALAHMQCRSAQLHIYGPATSYLSECEALVLRLGLKERVRFFGYVERTALMHAYAEATVAVVPSHYEGFGFAAAQAVLAGIPLLVADRASLPEIAGASVPALDPNDARLWARHLDAICDATPPYEHAAAQRRTAAAQYFSWQAAARATKEIYALAQQ